jgi:glutamyl-Q tRNA(Asp) synthetase
MASYCDARHNQGQWLLRIDDIDPPREAEGATRNIIKTLKAFGFLWDEEILFQSNHTVSYQTALQQLSTNHLLYCCTCTRAKLAGMKHYPGYCLPAQLAKAQTDVLDRLQRQADDSCLRLHIDSAVEFTDRLHGPITTQFNHTPDDPVLYRKDGLYSYTLACAIDDADGITHVVRGSDLIGTTAHQVALMQALDLPHPIYAHIPVATNALGQKLSKQTQAAVLDIQNAIALLGEAWLFLGQAPFRFSSIGEFWNEAIALWQIEKSQDKGHD